MNHLSRVCCLLAICVTSLCSAETQADNYGNVDSKVSIITSNEVWLICTRGSSSTSGSSECCAKDEDGDDIRAEYWMLGSNHRWITSTKEEFLRTDNPETPTCFFVHGNRYSKSEAIKDGLIVYEKCKEEGKGKPFRFVIWSWPSDRIEGRNRPDVQIKAHRSDLQSLCLASCINEIDSDVQICLIGHSFGARMIMGAMHILGGGDLVGQSLDESTLQEKRTAAIRAVLVAAALDSGSLLPGGRNSLALGQLDRVLITCNCRDRALKWYSRMYRGRGRGPAALGYVGLGCFCQYEEEGQKIRVLNLSREVRKAHDWSSYLSSSLRARIGRYAFFGSKN